MKINYLYEGGPFGSYKNKRNSESARNEVAKELAHVAKTALLDNLYTKIGELIKEHIDNNEKMYLNYNNSGLSLVGKNRNNESVYSYWTDVNASDWKNLDAIPVFRLVLENNIIVVIMSCITHENYKIAIQSGMSWFKWMKYLKRFLNYNIDRITEDGSSFNYDGFDVKLEIDPDILDNDGRVNVNFMNIKSIYNINQMQEFVDLFYKQNIRIKTKYLSFFESMSSNEMHKQYIERFSDLIKSTQWISLDMSTMKEFDLENLNIISVLAYPHSEVIIRYELKTNETGLSLKNIENFIHNEINMSFEELKEIAYKNRLNSISNLRSPEDLKTIYISYIYNNPRNLIIKGIS